VAVVLVGANPGLLLREGGAEDGPATAFASVWRVDWSIRGAGDAVVLVRPDAVRVLATDPTLGRWLATSFVRNFPECGEVGVDASAFDDVTVEDETVAVELDLVTGMVAKAGDVEVRVEDVLDRRIIRVPELDMAGTPHGLQLLYAPCRTGSLTVAGERVAGEPTLTDGAEPSSTAFVAVAEVWTSPPA